MTNVPTKKEKNLLIKKCPVPEKCLSSTSSPFGYYYAHRSCTELGQTSKTRQKLDWKKSWNCACNNLTNSESEVLAKTGNGSYENMPIHICIWKKLVKSHQVNLFLAGFSHLEPWRIGFFLFIKRMQDAHFCKHHDASGARIFTRTAYPILRT